MNRLTIILSLPLILFAQSHADTELPTTPKHKKEANIIYSTDPVKGIPQAWVDQQGLDVLRYANYIKSLNLKKIDPYTVLYPQFKKRGKISNSIPPRHLWENISETLKVIDQLAIILDAEVQPFISVYKNPAYNRSVKGRSKSQHLLNKAVCFKFKDVSPQKVAVTARQLRATGLFKGGVGNYKSFTHLDTRGHNADW